MTTRRQLDALVAELVMKDQRPDAPPPDVWPRGKFGSGEHWLWSELARDWIARPFSSDIAEAWRVVEKVWDTHIPRTNGGTYRFQLNRFDSGGYVCEFATDPEGDFSTHSTGEADSAPAAICIAALKVVGVEFPA